MKMSYEIRDLGDRITIEKDGIAWVFIICQPDKNKTSANAIDFFKNNDNELLILIRFPRCAMALTNLYLFDCINHQNEGHLIDDLKEAGLDENLAQHFIDCCKQLIVYASKNATA